MAALFSRDESQPGLAGTAARAARWAVGGLILPPALLAAASLAGAPVRAHVEVLSWSVAMGGFGLAGLAIGRRLRPDLTGRTLAAAGVAAGGVALTPAFHAVQGLSGREPALAVAGSVVGGFALGFAVVGAALGVLAGARGAQLRAVARTGALAGALGGAVALLPWAWAHLPLEGPLAGYARMAVAVLAFLGCLILPFRLVGRALDAQRDATSS